MIVITISTASIGNLEGEGLAEGRYNRQARRDQQAGFGKSQKRDLGRCGGCRESSRQACQDKTQPSHSNLSYIVAQQYSTVQYSSNVRPIRH